jgi:hypothetical protein
MLVYISIIFVFFFLPLYVLHQIHTFMVEYSSAIKVDDGLSTLVQQTVPPIKLYLSYYIPQIQIPLELTIAHLGFLTLLDRKKNSIGKFLFKWLHFISARLGLSRFLLPYQIRRIDVNKGFIVDHLGVPMVGPPLKRPPRGWDSRTNRHTVSYFAFSLLLFCLRHLCAIILFLRLDSMGMGTRRSFQSRNRNRSSFDTKILVSSISSVTVPKLVTGF